jgi:hypothetical protein
MYIIVFHPAKNVRKLTMNSASTKKPQLTSSSVLNSNSYGKCSVLIINDYDKCTVLNNNNYDKCTVLNNKITISVLYSITKLR